MKRNKPLFSIVVPTLNEEDYLGILLESLSKQSYKNFEVIICDGLSEDDTYGVYKRFKTKKYRN